MWNSKYWHKAKPVEISEEITEIIVIFHWIVRKDEEEVLAMYWICLAITAQWNIISFIEEQYFTI